MSASRETNSGQLLPFLQVCRVHQYTKNLFIFAPLFFAGRIEQRGDLVRVITAFIATSLLASTVYIINDYLDREEDRRHPKKRLRPLASGQIKPAPALVLAACLFVCSALLTAWLVPEIGALLAAYFGINLCYTFLLKKYSLVDVTLIALGFVLRLFVGGQAAQLPLSHWIVITTFLLALFLALAKRRDDVVLSSLGQPTRKSINGYNEMFLSTAMAVVAAVVIIAYLMYTLSPEVTARVGNNYLYTTSFFVILGFLRYLQITFVEGRSGSPSEIVLSDRFIQAVLVLWLACFAWIIY